MNVLGFRRFLGYLGIISRAPKSTPVTATTGATLTGAALAGGVLVRSGLTAAATDTTDTAANLIAGLPIETAIGTSWQLTYSNTTAYPVTLAAGSGVTFTPASPVVPALTAATILFTYSAAGTITAMVITVTSSTELPDAKFTTAAYVGPTTFAAGDLTGAKHTVFDGTGTTPGTLTTRTATQMFADTPNAQVGYSYLLTIRNDGTSTMTIAYGTGVTGTGPSTIAAATAETRVMTFTSPTTLTFAHVGTSAS